MLSECDRLRLRFIISPLGRARCSLKIDDCFKEREFLEKGDYLGYGQYLAEQGISGLLQPRIIEVYRLCYEKSEGSKQYQVVTAFIAYFPQLVFQAEWLAKLVTKYGLAPNLESDGPGGRMFSAIAKGFKDAAKQKGLVRQRHSSKLMGASLFREIIQRELTEWYKSIESYTVGRKWELIGKKVKELCERYPALALRTRQSKLKGFLEFGRNYEAAVFIASTLYSVRARELETRRTNPSKAQAKSKPQNSR